MDDFKIILWIIIGLIYLFSRRKKEEPAPRRPQPAEESEPMETTGPAPKTFEELLREIEGMKQPQPPPRPVERQPEVVDYDENLGEEERDLEDLTPSYRRDEEQIYKVYEEAKAQAFSRPSLEETVKLEDTIVRFKQFKGYEKEGRTNVLHEYLQELRDPKGFKKAFVLSEVLKPKF
ncbi:MAG: hypothetical protein JNN04_08860 [Cyclobacteriaceae bacterium]|nr:hypothetical protein [Cyclobacteriaceae bacterium]